MDSQLGRDILAQLKALVKAQIRIAHALEAANAADPLAMIQEALGGDRVDTGAVVQESDEDKRMGDRVQEMLATHGTRGADLPESERWRLGDG